MVPISVVAAFDALVADVAAIQADYLAEHGTYWQGAATEGDAEAQPASPLVSWADVGLAPPACIVASVDCYGGPEGAGWVVRGQWTDPESGAIWRRAANVGPETWREQDWQEASTP